MKVNVIYWTSTGNTELMAEAVFAGVEEAGAEAKLLQVSDATIEDVKDADAVALGCPASGDEELDDTEFEPYLETVEEFCKGKKILLFGSYNWADGEFMKTWVDRMNALGADLVAPEGIISYDDPDEEKTAELKEAGKKLAC